jgi:hypothetical protein
MKTSKSKTTTQLYMLISNPGRTSERVIASYQRKGTDGATLMANGLEADSGTFIDLLESLSEEIAGMEWQASQPTAAKRIMQAAAENQQAFVLKIVADQPYIPEPTKSGLAY